MGLRNGKKPSGIQYLLCYLPSRIAECSRQPQDNIRYQNEYKQRADQHGDKWPGFTNDFSQWYTGHRIDYEQQHAKRRGDQSYHGINDGDHAEMHQVDTKLAAGGYEQGQNYQDDCCRFQ